LLKPDQTEATEFAPAMDETAVAGKPVQVGFDGGRLTYDADGAPITIRVHPTFFGM